MPLWGFMSSALLKSFLMDHPLFDSYGQPWITEDIPMGGVSKNKHIRLFNI